MCFMGRGYIANFDDVPAEDDEEDEDYSPESLSHSGAESDDTCDTQVE